MDNIGEKTKAAIIEAIDELTSNYLSEIDEAYSLTQADLDLTYKVKLRPDPNGGVSIQADLAFMKGQKIKDSIMSKAQE